MSRMLGAGGSIFGLRNPCVSSVRFLYGNHPAHSGPVGVRQAMLSALSVFYFACP